MYYYFKNMVDENISQEFRLKNLDETKILKEIKQNELMSNNLKNVYQNYIKHFLILASTVTGCI